MSTDTPCASSFDANRFAELTDASSSSMAAMGEYRHRLTAWSERVNLVGPTVLKDFWGRHAYDSAQLLSFAPGMKRWADVGSGAGFPGVILAILLKDSPNVAVHLIESTLKRGRFLEDVVRALQLPAVVHIARAESIRPPDGLQVVTARACAPMSRLLAYCQAYFSPGVQGLFLKGQGAESELTEARRTWTVDADLQQSLSDPSGRVVRIKSLARA